MSVNLHTPTRPQIIREVEERLEEYTICFQASDPITVFLKAQAVQQLFDVADEETFINVEWPNGDYAAGSLMYFPMFSPRSDMTATVKIFICFRQK